MPWYYPQPAIWQYTPTVYTSDVRPPLWDRVMADYLPLEPAPPIDEAFWLTPHDCSGLDVCPTGECIDARPATEEE